MQHCSLLLTKDVRCIDPRGWFQASSLRMMDEICGLSCCDRCSRSSPIYLGQPWTAVRLHMLRSRVSGYREAAPVSLRKTLTHAGVICCFLTVAAHCGRCGCDP